MKTNIRNTSLDAYFYIRGRGIDLKQEGIIYQFLKVSRPRTYTRKEIADCTGIALSSVTPRVNKMIADKWLKDSTVEPRGHGGKAVHIVEINK